MKKPALLAFLVLILTSTTCNRKKIPLLVAEAGDCKITEQDLTYRQAVLKITEEGRIVEPGIVLSHLLKPCVGAAIMKKYGQPVTQEVLEGEAKRIDESTFMPDVLARIKQVFGENREAYLKDYILPVYVNRVLPYDIVRQNREIQAYARSEAQGWLDRVKANPGKFNEWAKERTGGEPRWARVSKTGGWEPFDRKDPRRIPPPPAAPQGAPQAAAGALAQQRWSQQQDSIRWVEGLIDTHLKDAVSGMLLPDLLEFPDSFLAGRYEKKEGDATPGSPLHSSSPKQSGGGDAYLLRFVSFPKREYDDFFFDAAKEFPVRATNPAAVGEMKRLVPWSQKFSFRPE
ncbi:MAG: hypothetical protein HYT87_01615 [Nitrospirae bacterium]|nr:hypothetical protein [Nitrospirota bacterium]